MSETKSWTMRPKLHKAIKVIHEGKENLPKSLPLSRAEHLTRLLKVRIDSRDVAQKHEEMGDSDLVSLVERIGYVEGLPVVVDPKIIEPRRFLREVLEIRFPNPFMPDTPQRIASDTSQKLPIRFGETIKAYLARRDLSISSLTAIPLVFAGWLRYLMGVDDAGSSFEPSPDPRLEELRAHVAGIALGDEGPFHGRLEPILSDATIFGVNLYDAGLGEIVERRFAELVSAPGAVRRTLSVHLR